MENLFVDKIQQEISWKYLKRMSKISTVVQFQRNIFYTDNRFNCYSAIVSSETFEAVVVSSARGEKKRV